MIRSVRELLRSKARFFLLATGAAMAATSTLVSRPSHAADATPPGQIWTLSAPPNIYVIHLRGATLTIDCHAATSSQDSTDNAAPADVAMIRAGPRRQPVMWRILSI